LRILSYSPTNTSFVGNSGNIAYFKLIAGSVPGNYPLNLVNPIISDSNSNNILTDIINGTLTVLSNSVSYPETNYDNTEFSILQNYPNPFKGMTTISFSATESLKYAFIKIYNIKGKLVKTIIPIINNKSQITNVVWDGRDYKGMRVPSGVYFCRLEVKDKEAKWIFSKIHKIVIIK
jgi:flagellar hook assembly protein FlgD